jgi:hypothetical protein
MKTWTRCLACFLAVGWMTAARADDDGPELATEFDWSREAEAAFHQVEVLRSAAAELRAAGIHDIADAATERAEHVKRQYIAHLHEQQRQVAEQLHAARQAISHRPPAADQLVLRCQLIEVQADGVPTHLAQQILPRPQPPEPAHFAVLSQADHQECQQELKRLVQRGAAKILAQPTVRTVNGQPVQFHSGGEFMIPVPQANGDVTLEPCAFGVSLDATPQRQPDGRWRIQFRLEVADRDENTGVTLAGATVPGLTKRTCETTTVLESGQTLVMAGLKGGDKHLVVLMTAESPAPEPVGAPQRRRATIILHPHQVLPAPPLPNPVAP